MTIASNADAWQTSSGKVWLSIVYVIFDMAVENATVVDCTLVILMCCFKKRSLQLRITNKGRCKLRESVGGGGNAGFVKLVDPHPVLAS